MTVEEVRKHEADFEEWFVKVGYMLTYPNAEHTVDINHDMKVAMVSSYLKGIEDGYKQSEKDNQEKIEKMKCCENCRHHNEGDCQSEHTFDCKYWNKQNEYDFWEEIKDDF